jgi:hypothetical protein
MAFQPAEESSSINIIKNLQILERLTVEEEIDMSQLNSIYTLLVETAEWTYETIISDEIDIGLQILDLLYYLDKVDLAH